MMQKVKNFVGIFLNSVIPDVGYYHKILSTSFINSVKYLSILVLTLNLIFVISLMVRYSPGKVKSIINGMITGIDKFPNNLVIFIRKGNLLTTYDRPYFFWLDYDSKKKLIFVIDENATPNKINQYRSKFLLTSNSMVFNDFSQNLITPLRQLNDQTINKQRTLPYFKSVLLKIGGLLPILYPLSVLTVFFGLALISFITIIFYLIFASLINLVLFRFLALKNLTLKKALQISFYAITLPLTLDYFLMAFKIKPIPILFFLLMLLFMFCGIYEAYLDHEKKAFLTSHHPGKHISH